jgi:hypothetical protein
MYGSNMDERERERDGERGEKCSFFGLNLAYRPIFRK